MGTVHAAFDRQLDRKVALKLVRASHRDDPRLRDRMLREAQAMARLSHPNVIPVFEVGELGSSLYLAMEYVDGQSLARWQRTPRPWRAVLEMYRNVGAGLSAAHEAGLIHRDFKPEN
ncbi:MAG: serine/threonine protein kinase, partial [Myxococcales bacterium]|nr:serine/threonine protein kinase [Myxococcales bacterium]